MHFHGGKGGLQGGGAGWDLCGVVGVRVAGSGVSGEGEGAHCHLRSSSTLVRVSFASSSVSFCTVCTTFTFTNLLRKSAVGERGHP